RFGKMYTRDGQELELRLNDAPLDDHDQVTSRMGDGRGHKGVDFRTPVGTPVKATFDATVARKTWNFKSNGNSLELHENGGARTTAFSRQLPEVPAEVKVGDKVTRGQVVARSGNTGHSFSPHLHYQLQSSGGAVIDPFAGPTHRAALPAEAKSGFLAEAD